MERVVATGVFIDLSRDEAEDPEYSRAEFDVDPLSVTLLDRDGGVRLARLVLGSAAG